ncbi:hypothetical protein [Streptomyces sp. DH8]|uniref:hypothetical protein n=1 Tax=Streptomyces sp. DH8 TaxID=2857008 RepID=UPI001E45F6AF|nr:hypothetical protein [Streptomyces sp. DH8]
MSIRLADLDIHWTGTDDTTPDGHVLVLAIDNAGVLRLCLYAGDTPSDDQFRGSLLIPPEGHKEPFLPTRTTAYGPGGAWATSSGDQTSMLARLANLT